MNNPRTRYGACNAHNYDINNLNYEAYAKWCKPGHNKDLEEYMPYSCQRSHDHLHVTDHYLPIMQTSTCCMLTLSWLVIPFFRMRDW